jgi:hypothetical protein
LRGTVVDVVIARVDGGLLVDAHDVFLRQADRRFELRIGIDLKNSSSSAYPSIAQASLASTC